MAITKCSREYHEKCFRDTTLHFWRRMEFMEIWFDNFAFDEVINEEGQGWRTGQDSWQPGGTAEIEGVDEYRPCPAAMNFRVTPVENQKSSIRRWTI